METAAYRVTERLSASLLTLITSWMFQLESDAFHRRDQADAFSEFVAAQKNPMRHGRSRGLRSIRQSLPGFVQEITTK